MNNKGISHIFVPIVVIIALILGGTAYYIGNQSNSTVDPVNTSGESLKTYTASFNQGFEEDQWRISYELKYPGNRFRVAQGSPQVNRILITEGNQDHFVEFFYNGAAGFTSAFEVFTEKQYCLKCTKVANPSIQIQGAQNLEMYANETEEWILFKKDPDYVIIKMMKPTSAIRNVIQTLKITAEKLPPPQPPVAQTRTIKLFYVHAPTDTQLGGCVEESIMPVARTIPVSISPIKDTIQLLLKGHITPSEKEGGYISEFPLPGLTLQSVNLNNGVLTIQLNDGQSATSGGSCRAGMLATQIRKTALQFPEVKQVRFLPEGELFQP
jgi:hypothetical protein